MDKLLRHLRDAANGMASFKTDTGDYGLADDAAARIEALEAENAALREALDGASEKGRGYTLKKIREDLGACGFSGKDAELVITYLLNSGLIQIGSDMKARAALARQTEGEG